MNKKNLRSKEPRKGEINILDALKDKPQRTIPELKKIVKLSKPSLYEDIKLLYERHWLTYDLLTKGYSITSEGSNYLKKNNTWNTIKNEEIKVSMNPPIETVVGMNVKISEDQRNQLNDGTAKVASAVFQQLVSDMKENPEKFPAAGTITFVVSFDVADAHGVVVSDAGKKYFKRRMQKIHATSKKVSV